MNIVECENSEWGAGDCLTIDGVPHMVVFDDGWCKYRIVNLTNGQLDSEFEGKTSRLLIESITGSHGIESVEKLTIEKEV